MTAGVGGVTSPVVPPPGQARPRGGERFATLLAARLHEPVEVAGQPGVRRLRLGEMVAGSAPGVAAPAGVANLAAPAGVANLAAPAGVAGLASATLPPAAGGAGADVVAAVRGYLGVPYRWGGTDPATGLDCSGLVQRAFADLGVALPRVSADQARAGESVPSLAEARPGDLVFWRGRGGRPNHIGVYLGGGQMIHAPRTGDVVKVDRVRSAPPDAIRRVR